MTSSAESGNRSAAPIADRLLEFLDRRGVRRTASGSPEPAAGAWEERVELGVDPVAFEPLPRTMRDFGRESDLRIIGATVHAGTAARFVFAGHDGSNHLRFLVATFRATQVGSDRPPVRLPRAFGRPEGLWIAFLGPDGTGKSTIIRQVAERLAPAFRGTAQYHLRPHFGRERSMEDDGGAPTRGRPRGVVTSLAKLAWWWLDYTIGFAIHVRPRLAVSTLVLFDRYYVDLHVDPIRYRFGGPDWLARAVGRAIPEPDMYIVLHAPARILTERKGELSTREAELQLKAWEKMASRSARIRLVDSATSIENTLLATERIILDLLERRIARRLGWPLDDTGTHAREAGA